MADGTRKHVVVASQNPVKLLAAQEGFQRMWPGNNYTFAGVSAASGVPDQPLTDQETLQGAINRARNVRDLEPSADYWVGLESGIHAVEGGEMQCFAWVAVLASDGTLGRGRSGTWFLPQETVALVRKGMELGDADNLLHGTINSKQKTGTVGILTGGAINRQGICADAVVLALIPFKNTALTFGPEEATTDELGH